MKKIIAFLVPFIMGISCLIAFKVIGSEVAPDGTLIEPFFLLPIGYLLIAVSIILCLIISIVSLLKNSKKNRTSN